MDILNVLHNCNGYMENSIKIISFKNLLKYLWPEYFLDDNCELPIKESFCNIAKQLFEYYLCNKDNIWEATLMAKQKGLLFVIINDL